MIVDVSTAHLRSSLKEKPRCRPVTTTKALRKGFRLGLSAPGYALRRQPQTESHLD